MTDHRTIGLWLILFTSLFFLQSCGIARTGMGPLARDRAADSSLRAGSAIQSGLASWYGPNFHGKLTANGESYDMDDLTAAHKTLPFNTVVRVRNQTNGKHVDVRINDRGPYVGDRIIDLSRAAARAIEMIGPGTAKVELYLLSEGDRPITRSNTSSRENFTVQLASFDSRERAAEEARKVQGAEVVRVRVNGKDYYRVYYGNYSTIADANVGLNKISRQGHSGFVKQREN